MKDITLRGWAILAVCAVCPGVTFGLMITGFPFWVGPWMDAFHVNRSTVMVAFTAGGLVMSLATPLVGRALDSLSVRSTAALGVLVTAAGIGLTAAAQSYWQVILLFATLVPIGVAFSGMLPAASLATRMFPRHAGMVNGVITVGLSLGGVAIAASASQLIAAVGWRETFLIAAAVLVLGLIPLVWVAFSVPQGAPARSQPVAPTADMPPEASKGLNVLRTPIFWVILGCVLPLMLALSAVPPNLADISKDFGFPPGAATTLVSVFSLSAAVGSVGGGWLSDRAEHWLVYAGIAAAVMLALAGLSLAPGMTAAVALLGVFGLAGGMTMPWVAAVVARRFGPSAFARVMGFMAPFYIPASFFPIAVAWIRDTTGSYQPAFIACAAAVAAGGFLVPLIREDKAAAVASKA